MPKVNTQSIKFNWKGEYNPATAYVTKDVVSFKGQSFVCDADATGIDPTTTSNWSKHNSASNLVDLEPSDNSILQYDGSAFTAVSPATTGQIFQSQGASTPSWATLESGAKETFFRNQTDNQIGNVAHGATFDEIHFTPNYSGLLFVSYTWEFRSNPNSAHYHYWEMDFNNGFTWYPIRYDGFNRSASGSDHLQTGKVTLVLNDQTHLRAVAGQLQKFRLRHNSSGSATLSGTPANRMSWVVMVL